MSSIEQQIRLRRGGVGSALGALAGRPLITTRGIQVALGVLWLLDGLFQFKSFMYTHAIVSQVFAPAAAGQPSYIAGPMHTFATFYGRDLTLWNTLAGEVQVAIGLGLILSRRTVRPALAVALAWSLVVWWFGEGFGGLTSTTLPSPLMGAPGAVILYGLIGLLVWPSGTARAHSPAGAGPLGERGALAIFSGLWTLSAALWLVDVNRAQGATHEMIKAMASASPHWLASAQNSLNSHTAGHGTAIAIALAGLSAAIALAVWLPALRWPALIAAIAVSLAYWVIGQDLGGPFWAASATDVNSGPLFVLLAISLLPVAQRPRAAPREAGEPAEGPAQAAQLASP